MWEYNHSEYLMHAKKGGARKDHKYIKREWKNGRWVYYYADDLKKQSESNDKTIHYSNKIQVKPTLKKPRSFKDYQAQSVIKIVPKARKRTLKEKASKFLEKHGIYNRHTYIENHRGERKYVDEGKLTKGATRIKPYK